MTAEQPAPLLIYRNIQYVVYCVHVAYHIVIIITLCFVRLFGVFRVFLTYPSSPDRKQLVSI